MKMINALALAVFFIAPTLCAGSGETEAGKTQTTQSTITPLQRAGHTALGIGKLTIAASWIAMMVYFNCTLGKEAESALEKNYLHNAAAQIPLASLTLLCLLWGSKSAYHSAVESFKKARA